jgi:hypothetical protein
VVPARHDSYNNLETHPHYHHHHEFSDELFVLFFVQAVRKQLILVRLDV